MIIYGVYMRWQPEDILVKMFDSAEKANAAIDGAGGHYFVQEMEVY